MTSQFRPLSVRDILAALSTFSDTTLRSLSEAQERAVNALHLAGFSSFSPVSVSTAADEHGGVTITLRIALPGFNKSDVSVAVAERSVQVTAEHGENHPLGLTGKVEVAYPLPFTVDAPRSTCELKDGVLTLTLPSLQQVAKAVKVQVN